MQQHRNAPSLADAYFIFSLQVVFVELKKSKACVTHTNRKPTEPRQGNLVKMEDK